MGPRMLAHGMLGVRRYASNVSSGKPSLDDVLKRVESLEAQANQHGWARQSQQAPQPEQQRKKQGDPTMAEKAADKAAGVMEDAAADAVQRLHPALIKFLNSGYLVSQGELRQRLMQSDWENNVRAWAQRKGLAEFEQWLAEKGDKEGITVGWQVMEKLYINPEDLSPLNDNPRARLLAHAMIQRAMFDKQMDTFKAATDTAKQLANVIESGQRTGASTVLSGLKNLLPLPFLK